MQQEQLQIDQQLCGIGSQPTKNSANNEEQLRIQEVLESVTYEWLSERTVEGAEKLWDKIGQLIDGMGSQSTEPNLGMEELLEKQDHAKHVSTQPMEARVDSRFQLTAAEFMVGAVNSQPTGASVDIEEHLSMQDHPVVSPKVHGLPAWSDFDFKVLLIYHVT